MDDTLDILYFFYWQISSFSESIYQNIQYMKDYRK
jgi:hypothetical protein